MDKRRRLITGMVTTCASPPIARIVTEKNQHPRNARFYVTKASLWSGLPFRGSPAFCTHTLDDIVAVQLFYSPYRHLRLIDQ